MNAESTETLADPGPCGHLVYLYTDETQLAEAVCLFAAAGFRKGEAVILIMTEAHNEPMRERLRMEGFILEEMARDWQLVWVSAENLVSTFLLGGMIDESKFKTNLGTVIERTQARGGTGPNRPVRVFGEMVDSLWRRNPRATLRLEELWNDVIETCSVPLLCAYFVAGIVEITW